jgi:hypothetical protein
MEFAKNVLISVCLLLKDYSCLSVQTTTKE